MASLTQVFGTRSEKKRLDTLSIAISSTMECSVVYSRAAHATRGVKEEEFSVVNTNEKRELYAFVSKLAGFVLTSKETSCSSGTCSR